MSTAHARAAASSVPPTPAAAPRHAYSTANARATAARVAPSVFRITVSYSRWERVAASVDAITVIPTAMLMSAMSRMARPISARTVATRSSTCRTGMAVTFGNAATT